DPEHELAYLAPRHAHEIDLKRSHRRDVPVAAGAEDLDDARGAIPLEPVDAEEWRRRPIRACRVVRRHDEALRRINRAREVLERHWLRIPSGLPCRRGEKAIPAPAAGDRPDQLPR